jgi:hypothetical protein
MNHGGGYSRSHYGASGGAHPTRVNEVKLGASRLKLTLVK